MFELGFEVEGDALLSRFVDLDESDILSKTGTKDDIDCSESMSARVGDVQSILCLLGTLQNQSRR